MLSRRDKLLVRPWQDRRYQNHLRKVQSALPAIDNQPPASRNHVAVKTKRKQSENERCSRIEKDNLILLQKLSSIMRTNRVDNYWVTPQPNFLNRVSIYDTTSKRQYQHERSEDFVKKTTRIRTAKCLACSPQEPAKLQIPEERVPWEPEKSSMRRVRSKSEPIKKAVSLPTVQETTSFSTTPESTKSRKQSAKTDYKNVKDITSPQLILSRGPLMLAVNFPADTYIKLKDGTSEKLITGGLCQCKNITKIVI